MKKKLISRMIAIVIAMMIIVPASMAPAQGAATLDKTFTFYMCPNSHLDTAWQWPFSYTASNYVRTMYTNATTALSSTTYTGLKFTTSASAHLKMIKDYYNDDNPTASQRLWTLTKQLVDKGQMDLAGGQVVEPDLNIPGGEALTRQSLYAQHFFEREFTLNGGRYVARTGMVPDVFGFSGQMPQILFKSEMKYFVTSKVNWNGQSTGATDPGYAIGSTYEHFRQGSRQRDSDIQTWQALDGKSRVIANYLQNDYNNTSPANSIQAAFDANWVTTSGNDTSGFPANQNFHGGVRNTQIKRAVLFYGGGDTGSGMNSGLSSTDGNSFRHHESVATSSVGSRVNVKTSTITQFFDELVANENLDRIKPENNGNYIEGELYAEFHRGTYSTWARIKKYNRDCEILGESAEKAATIAYFTNSVSTNSQQRIEDGWYKVLISQMHDVLPGSALAWQSYLSFNQYELAKNLFNGVEDNALAALAYRADTDVAGKPVFVYNDLSWARSSEVTVSLLYDAGALPADVVVYDGAKAINPTKVVADADKNRLTVTFMATDIPATGFKVYDVRAETPVAAVAPLSFDQDSWTIANNNLRVKFNPSTGYISSLQTIVGGAWKEMFAQGVGTEGGELHVYKDCDTVSPSQNFHQWEVNIDELNKEPDFIFDDKPLSMKVTCNTPEKVTVSVVKSWNGAEVTQDYTVYADSDRVDVHLDANWYQPKRLLKVSFPIAADNGYAAYETSYGAVERPTNRDNGLGRARFEVPVHKWADVTDKSGGWGVSIINDAKYGNDSLRKVMSNGTVFVRNRITVVRVPVVVQWAPGSGTWTPPAVPYTVDAARHQINYAIYPHEGSWKNARTVNEGLEVNHPVKAFEAVKGPSHGFGRSESFASVNKPGVVISALKNQYDEPGNKNKVILRVYEATGVDTSGVTVTLPGNVISAKEVNMLEHDYDAAHGYNVGGPWPNSYTVKPITASGNTVSFDIGHYEVLTIEAVLAPSSLATLTVPQQSVPLAFNSRGTSGNATRRDGFIEGAGTTSSSGLSMPNEHWPEGNKINYNGIEFDLGPKDANNFINGTTANQNITVTAAQKYSKLYIVGAAVGTGVSSVAAGTPYQNYSATGTFNVSYAEGGAATSKAILFHSWRTELSGWNKAAFMDDHSYVYDTVAHFNGHYHQSTGTSNSSELYEIDNYLFLYDIDLDPARTVSTIQIPVSANIKIAAITLADPVDGFGTVYDPSTAADSDVNAPTPGQVQNVKADYDPSTNNVDFRVTWDKADNAVSYNVYRGTTPTFTANSSSLLGSVGGVNYTDIAPSLTGAQINAGTTQYYYRVTAIGKASNAGTVSAASNGIAPQYVDYALNVVTSENTARVVANRQQSSEQAYKAINGLISGTSNKWCATGVTASNPGKWAIDLTGSATATPPRIEFVRINHSVEGGNSITGAFSLAYATTSTVTTLPNMVTGTSTTLPNGFTQLANITGNSTLITTHNTPGFGIGGTPMRYILLQVTNPVSSGTDANNATRIYEVYAIGINPAYVPPPPASTATNARIVKTPTLSANQKFDQLYVEADYDFYNSDAAVTEDLAKTEFKWYKTLTDNYRTYTVAVGAGKSFFQGINDGLPDRCEITVYDSNGRKGTTVNVSTATSGAPVNVLRSPTVATCIDRSTDTTALMLVDGINGTNNKWNVITNPATANNQGACPHWATFDMGSARNFNIIKVYHANSYATSGWDGDPGVNTYDFDVMYSMDNINWETTQIRANMAAITTIDFGRVVQARYIKLYVITPNAYSDPSYVGGVGEGTYLSIRIGELEALYDESKLIANAPAMLYQGGSPLLLADAKGKTVDVKTRFYTNPVLSGSVNIYAAAYGIDGKLLVVKQGVATFDAEGILDFTIQGFAVPADTAAFKAFYWTPGSEVPISELVVVG